MELTEQGASLGFVTDRLTVSLQWSFAADFDLAVLYHSRLNDLGLLYFGNRGTLLDYPYMQLGADQGVADSGGEHEEVLRIQALEDMQRVYLFCWDFGKVQVGEAARFDQGEVFLTLRDDMGQDMRVNVATAGQGNVCRIAQIENGEEMGFQLFNVSKIGTLNGLSDKSQLLALLD